MDSAYADALKEHARIAVRLYTAQLPELQRLSGLQFTEDGSNTAETPEDLKRYLLAIKAIGGPVAYLSARMVLMNAINKRGLSLPSLMQVGK